MKDDFSNDGDIAKKNVVNLAYRHKKNKFPNCFLFVLYLKNSPIYILHLFRKYTLPKV